MNRRIFGIGESTVDLIIRDNLPLDFKPGGAVINACISLGRLGLDVSVITSCGNDKLGKISREFLEKNNVKTSYITEFDGNTRLALAFLDEMNNADYYFYQDPSHSFSVKIPFFKFGDILLHGSSFSLKEANHALIKRLIASCKMNNILIFYDPNFRSSYKEKLREIYPYILYNFENADIIKGSNEDFHSIMGTDNAVDTYNKLAALGQKILVYTQGSDGIWIISSSEERFIEIEKVQPVSTIGAGDTLNAGIIYGLVRHEINKGNLYSQPGEIWEDILKRAAKFSAEVCLSIDNYISVDTGKEESDK